MPDSMVHLIADALVLEKIGSLFLVSLAGSLIYLLVFSLPPMIREFLKSVSASLERISVTLAEVVLTNGRIHVDVGDYSDMMLKHHENAVVIKDVTTELVGKVDEANKTLDRIEVTLNNRPCIR